MVRQTKPRIEHLRRQRLGTRRYRNRRNTPRKCSVNPRHKAHMLRQWNMRRRCSVNPRHKARMLRQRNMRRRCSVNLKHKARVLRPWNVPRRRSVNRRSNTRNRSIKRHRSNIKPKHRANKLHRVRPSSMRPLKVAMNMATRRSNKLFD